MARTVSSRLPLAVVLALAATPLWGQTSDEANRQRAMNTMREQAARADRSAFDAAMARQQSIANASRAPASSGQPVGGGRADTSGYAGVAMPGASTGPQSVVATRYVTIRAADAPGLVLARLEQQAKAGDGAAAYDLGRILNSDYPLPRDLPRARSAFELGANAGHAGAQGNYGYMLAEGIGGGGDVAAGTGWMKKSAEAGDRFGQLQYGMQLLKRWQDTDYDGAPAVHYLTLSADAGEVAAQAMLGTIYLYGMGVTEDDIRAAKYLKMASDGGERESTSILGSLFAAGRGGGSKEEGYALIRKASDAGIVVSQRIYGQMQLNGLGFPKNDVAGAALIKRAAEAGDPTAAALLGSLYVDGQGVPQDDAKGLRWWGIAAKRGHEGAKAQIASLTADQRRIAEAAKE